MPRSWQPTPDFTLGLLEGNAGQMTDPGHWHRRHRGVVCRGDLRHPQGRRCSLSGLRVDVETEYNGLDLARTARRCAELGRARAGAAPFQWRDRLTSQTNSPIAWSRSAMMSLTSSMPTDRRTTSGPAPGELQLLRGELAVGGRRRMDDERARVADIGEMRQQPGVRHRPHAGLIAALEAEGENGARSLRRVFLVQRVMLVGRPDPRS